MLYYIDMINRDSSYLIGNQFAKGNEPNQTSFKKGMAPWNKGIKGLHLSGKTEFKKGQKPINHKLVGTLSIRIDKSGTRRRWVKVAEPNIWVEYAKYLWARAGNELVKGVCLHHINNNSLDDRVDNLIMVSRGAHVKLHNRWNTKNIQTAKIRQRNSQGVLS